MDLGYYRLFYIFLIQHPPTKTKGETLKHLLLALFAVALLATSVNAQTQRRSPDEIKKVNAKKTSIEETKAKAKKEAEAKAKKETEEKAKKEALAKKEAEAKAKKEAEAKASKNVVTPAKPGVNTSNAEAIKKLEAAKKLQTTTAKPPVKK